MNKMAKNTTKELDNDSTYEISLQCEKNISPYINCSTQKISLYSHEILSQDYKYTKAKLSSQMKYIALIGKGTTDILYIWNLDNIYNHIHTIKNKKIFGIEFHPRDNAYVVVYENKVPSFYNITNHKKVSKFEKPSAAPGNIISYSFSPNGNFFGVAFTKMFVVWETTSGKRLEEYYIESPLKYFRGKVLLCITETNEINVYEISNKDNKQNYQTFKFNTKKDYNIYYTDILAGMLNTKSDRFFFVTSSAAYKINLKNGRIKTICKLNNMHIKQAQISEDCSMVIVSDLRRLYYYEIENITDEPGIILKEDFIFFEMYSNYNCLITVDNICINITDTLNTDTDEKFIWFDTNINKFERFQFSPNFDFFLGITSKNSAALYNIKTGRLVKKWKNNSTNWSECCVMVPDGSETAILATKSNDKEIKIWNMYNGNDVITLPNFNAASMYFSSNGRYLAVGCEEGTEIVRFFDISTGNYTSFINENK